MNIYSYIFFVCLPMLQWIEQQQQQQNQSWLKEKNYLEWILEKSLDPSK